MALRGAGDYNVTWALSEVHSLSQAQGSVSSGVLAGCAGYRAWHEGGKVSSETVEAEAAAAGEALFVENCAACHGPSGEGGLGPALVDNDFVAGQSEAGLSDLIQAGRPGTAMPALEGRLNNRELTAITAFLQSWQP